MSEPTIDEMLDWLDNEVNSFSTRDNQARYMPAIRAILEHQRLSQAPVARLEVEAIRAFVDRVHKRADEMLANDKTQELFSEHFMQAFLDELKATEKEAK